MQAQMTGMGLLKTFTGGGGGGLPPCFGQKRVLIAQSIKSVELTVKIGFDYKC